MSDCRRLEAGSRGIARGGVTGATTPNPLIETEMRYFLPV